MSRVDYCHAFRNTRAYGFRGDGHIAQLYSRRTKLRTFNIWGRFFAPMPTDSAWSYDTSVFSAKPAATLIVLLDFAAPAPPPEALLIFQALGQRTCSGTS